MGYATKYRCVGKIKSIQMDQADRQWRHGIDIFNLGGRGRVESKTLRNPEGKNDTTTIRKRRM